MFVTLISFPCSYIRFQELTFFFQLQTITDLIEDKIDIMNVGFETAIRLIEEAEWELSARKTIIACGGSEKDWSTN